MLMSVRAFLLLFVVCLLILPASAQWVRRDLPTSQAVRSIVVIPSATGGVRIYAGTVSSGLFVSADTGRSWDAAGLANESVLALAVLRDDSVITLVAGLGPGGIRVSTDGGTSWATKNTGLSNTNVLSIAAMRGGTSGFTLATGTSGGGVFQSVDRAENWSPAALSGWAVSGLSAGSGGFLGGTNGGGVFQSSTGATWTDISTGLLPDGGFVNATVTDEANGTMIAGAGNGVHLRGPGGTSWTRSVTGLVDRDVWSVAVTQEASGKKYYAGTWSGGVYVSTDAGGTWVSDSLAGPVVHVLTSFDDGAGKGLLVAGNGSGQVWVRPFTGTVVTSVEREAATPAEFMLEQNYPNPFNPSTIIGYTAPTAHRVIVSVFDLLGREVAKLADTAPAAGRRSLDWDASGLAAGTYVYRVEITTIDGRVFRSARRAVLLK